VPDLTVCVLNWRRPDNLRRIIDALARQTARPVVYLWEQSGERFRHPAVDWQVVSNRNLGCWPRWFMAARAQTEFVASLDDDLVPADDRLLADALDIAAAGPNGQAVGPFGANLDPAEDYSRHKPIQGVAVDTPVDLVKGRLLIVRTADLQRVSAALEPRGAFDCDDIILCGALAGCRPRRHLVPSLFVGRLEELPKGKVGLEHQAEHYARREAARRPWFPRAAAIEMSPRGQAGAPAGRSGGGALRIGTCITESYLGRAAPCLRSLPSCGLPPFVVTYGWRAPEATRRDFPGLDWFHLPAGQPADCNGCVQYGAWLDALPHHARDLLVMADSDAVFQRPLADDELQTLESLGDDEVALGPNADRKDTLLREAARLRRGARDPSDQALDRLYPGFARVRCYNCGFIAARASWWHRLRAAFVEAWPAFDRLFSHRARCQWLTCWLIHAMGSTVRRLPCSVHAHQHFGVPRGCRIDGRPPTVLCGGRPVFFAHHFEGILRWRAARCV